MNRPILSWLKVAGIALCAFLCVCWVAALKNSVNVTWSESVWAFAVSYFLLYRYVSRGNSYSLVISATVVGFLIIPLVVQVTHISSSLWSFISDIALVLGIGGAVLCYRHKHVAIMMLVAIILILFNSFCVPEWDAYVLHSH